jgi:hypothetical protein
MVVFEVCERPFGKLRSAFGAFDIRAFMIAVRRIRLGVSVSPTRS